MKKLTGIICGIMLLAGSSLFAEGPVAAGNIELGIGKIVSYDRIWNDDITVNGFNIGTFGNSYNNASEYGIMFPTPTYTFSYFVANGLALGLKGGYSYMKEKDADDPFTQWFIAPEVKFYVPLSEMLLIDAHGSVGYSMVDAGGEYNWDRMSFELGVGLDILFTQQFAMVIGVDYFYSPDRKVDGENEEDSAYSKIGVSVGFKTFLSMMSY